LGVAAMLQHVVEFESDYIDGSWLIAAAETVADALERMGGVNG
jgi:hypothetical protein